MAADTPLQLPDDETGCASCVREQKWSCRACADKTHRLILLDSLLQERRRHYMMLSQLKTISRCVLSAHARQLHFCSRTQLAQPVLSAGNCNGVSAAIGQAGTTLTSQSFLKPSTSLLTQTAGIKHVGKLSLRCRHCYFMVKDEQQFVMCTAKARHYQAQKQPAKK